MEKQKTNAIEAVALILGTILISSISAKSSVSSDDFYEKNIGLGEIEVDTELIYGSHDLPQISPISNVEITTTNVFDATFNYMGKTDLNGKCTLSYIHPGFYKIKAEKDGYVDMSLVRNYRIVQVRSSQTISVEFTLAEEGSPWDEEVISRELPGIITGEKDLQYLKFYYTIECFEYCSISGTYKTKTSSDDYQIIAGSDTKSMIVTGWALVADFGDLPHLRFCRIKTDSIKAETFTGICKDGNIRGKGIWVEIGNYEPTGIKSVRSKQLINLVEIIVNRLTIQ